MQAQIDKWAEHGNSEKPALSGVKGKAKAEAVAMRKAIKGIEDEKKLAEEIGGLMEAVEKEDAVSIQLHGQDPADGVSVSQELERS